MGGGISKHEDEQTTSSNIRSNQVVVPTGVAEAKPTTGGHEAAEEESKCPMHRSDGTYSYDWSQIFRAAAVHGPKGSKPISKEQQEEAAKMSKSSSKDTDTKHAAATTKESSSTGGGCPVKHPEYNVYSQPIDKTNQMPKGVKTQLPVATQRSELSTNRVSSTIPKGGGGGSDGTGSSTNTWTYPSPQQFYNALARKGKLDDDAAEEDMETVVALHNNMNEKTWAQVTEWEKQTYKETSTPKLLKFQGRPHDLSPKARLKHYLLGHPLPYDRHDWTVLRDDGTTVRYVIDYYYDESRARETAESAKPKLHDRDATPSLLIDVRPALDGPSQLFARTFFMPYKLWTEQTTFKPLPLRGTADMASQVQESVRVWQSIQQARKQEVEQEQGGNVVDDDDDENNNIDPMKAMKVTEDEAREVADSFAKVLQKCQRQQEKVDECQSDDECAKASVDLTMCMGLIFCPLQHQTLQTAIKAAHGKNDSHDDSETNNAKIEASLETLTECVIYQNARGRLAKKQFPKFF